MLVQSNSRVVAYVGGYGSGKSYGGAVASMRLAAVNAGLEGMLIAPTHKMLVRVTLPSFMRIAGSAVIDHNKYEARIDLINGSRIWYGSADSPGSLEGSNLSWWWLDEARLVSGEAYRILLGRLRVGNAPLLQAVVTTTPVAGGWLQDEFGTGRPDRQTIHSSSRENTHLDASFVDELLASYSPAQARAYVDGEWVSLSGAVYPEYDAESHIVDYTPDPSLPVVAGLDFGFRWPAVVYGQILDTPRMLGTVAAPAGSLVIFDEDMAESISTESLASRIALRFQASGDLSLSWIACDPAGAISGEASETAGDFDVRALRVGLADGGLGHVKLRYAWGRGSAALRQINTGIEKVRARLMNARQETRLYFARSLGTAGRGCLRAVPAYSYYEGSTRTIRGEKSGQICHCNDALRYLVRHLDIGAARVEQWA